MKKIMSYGCVFLLVLVASCGKGNNGTEVILPIEEEPEVSVPAEFEVRISAESYRVGEPVRFLLEGNSEVIKFHSGISSHLEMSFQSLVVRGNESNLFSVHASTDFSGVFTEEAIEAATWTDITGGVAGSFTAFTLATNQNATNSGVKNITDLLVDGRPLYLGIRYKSDESSTTTLRDWVVLNFDVSAVFEGTKTHLIRTTTNTSREDFVGEWNFVGYSLNPDGPAYNWRWNAEPGTTNAHRMVFLLPNPGTAERQSAVETWAIPEPIDPNLLKSQAVTIKEINDPMIPSYEYVFAEPGTYEVTFESWRLGTKLEKTVTVNIIP